MKKLIILAVILQSIVCNLHLYAQNIGVNSTGAAPNIKAMLDIDATGMSPKGGLLVPRLSTAERTAITAPIPEALLIYNTTTQCFEAWNATNLQWVAFGCIGCQLPVAPTAGANTPSTTQIVWNWSTVSGAAGYQWNTISTYPGSGVNVVATPTYTQTGLICNTGYTLYVWAYNSCGISTSVTLTQPSSACGPSCNTQTFAAANLDAGTMVNSTAGGFQQPSPYNYKYCYNNVAANCATYGGLYEWNNVMLGAASINCDPCGAGGVQGMCPAGFHIPTDLEWSRYEFCLESTIAPTGATTLATFQTTTGWRGSAVAGVGPGDKMKATSSNSPAWDGTNTSGFNALPAGYRDSSDGLFVNLGSTTFFWSATENDAFTSWPRNMNTVNRQVFRFNNSKMRGYSVRCLQN